jgi:hypothetical protein
MLLSRAGESGSDVQIKTYPELGGKLFWKIKISLSQARMTHVSRLYFPLPKNLKAKLDGLPIFAANGTIGDFELSKLKRGRWLEIFPVKSKINLDFVAHCDVVGVLTAESQSFCTSIDA